MQYGLNEEHEMIATTVRSFVENEIYPHEELVEKTGSVPKEIAQIESLVDSELAENTPVTIWVGADERSINIDQAKLLASKWSCPWFESKGKHHFDIIDGLETKSSTLMNVLLSNLD